MNFGDRKEILEKANKRLVEAKKVYKDAMLANPDDVRVIFLIVDDPKKYQNLLSQKIRLGSPERWHSNASFNLSPICDT